jgi:hypothetical protein
MRSEGTLETGQELDLVLRRGAELFCASGLAHLAVRQDWLPGGFAVHLRPGQSWRAAEATRVRVVAMEATRYRVVGPVPAPKKKPRIAGLWEQLSRSVRRVRRAA